MLGKLLKYEFKATGRVFLPLYLALIFGAVIASFALRSEIEIITILLGFLLFALYVALVVVTIVLLIQRFYQSLLRDEGYLMFTLPVNPPMLIASKLIAACIWCILSLIIGAAAGLIASSSFFSVSELFALINNFKEAYPYVSFPWLLIALSIATCVLQLVCSIMQVYFSLAVGQLPVFGGRRIIFAILAYLATSVVTQMAALAVMAAPATHFVGRHNTLEVLSTADDPAPYFATQGFAMNFASDVVSVMNTFVIAAFVFNLVFAAAMFFGTSWILKRKLNLE